MLLCVTKKTKEESGTRAVKPRSRLWSSLVRVQGLGCIHGLSEPLSHQPRIPRCHMHQSCTNGLSVLWEARATRGIASSSQADRSLSRCWNACSCMAAARAANHTQSRRNSALTARSANDCHQFASDCGPPPGWPRQLQLISPAAAARFAECRLSGCPAGPQWLEGHASFARPGILEGPDLAPCGHTASEASIRDLRSMNATNEKYATSTPLAAAKWPIEKLPILHACSSPCSLCRNRGLCGTRRRWQPFRLPCKGREPCMQRAFASSSDSMLPRPM